MRTIVFGGTGFFGKELVEILLSEGHHVTVVTRGNSNLPVHSNLTSLVADRTDLSSLNKVLANQSWDLAYDQLGYCSNEAEILSKALEGKIKHLIFTSSKSVYDYGTDLNEEQVDCFTYELKMGAREEFDYAEGKRQAEAFYLQKAPFSVGCFRPPVVIGMSDTSKRWDWHLNRIKNGEEIYFPDLEAHFCVVSSKEAGRALYEMGLKKIKGSLNFYTSNPKLKEILKIMEEGVGTKAILASESSKENHSPYGIEKDWFMSRAKAEEHGILSTEDFHSLGQTLSRLP